MTQYATRRRMALTHLGPLPATDNQVQIRASVNDNDTENNDLAEIANLLAATLQTKCPLRDQKQLLDTLQIKLSVLFMQDSLAPLTAWVDALAQKTIRWSIKETKIEYLARIQECKELLYILVARFSQTR